MTLRCGVCSRVIGLDVYHESGWFGEREDAEGRLPVQADEGAAPALENPRDIDILNVVGLIGVVEASGHLVEVDLAIRHRRHQPTENAHPKY